MIQEGLPAWPDLPGAPLPFFWLGADAEPAWPTFNGLTVAAPAFLAAANAWQADWRDV